jgi:integrase
VSAATLHRIHATLRAALNGAVRAGLIGVNPARYPELPRSLRPWPQVWTPALTDRWQTEGWRPIVGVWTAAQTAQFLRQSRGHRLYALFHLIALRGLRRGEAAGLRWSDLDLDAGTLTVTGQLQQLGGRLVAEPPKSDAGRRVISLDKTTIAALREHRARQRAEQTAAGTRWTQTGYVFTTRTGKPVAPDRMTRLFRELAAASGLPPVTLHGLRHGAATLALAAGGDLKVVQDQLGYSTVVLTADTYTSVLPKPPAPLPSTPPRSCSPRVPGLVRPGGRQLSKVADRFRHGRDGIAGSGITRPDPCHRIALALRMNGALHDVSRLAADDIQVGAECDDGGPGGVKESFQHP